jgi:hypothetical protein
MEEDKASAQAAVVRKKKTGTKNTKRRRQK